MVRAIRGLIDIRRVRYRQAYLRLGLSSPTPHVAALQYRAVQVACCRSSPEHPEWCGSVLSGP